MDKSIGTYEQACINAALESSKDIMKSLANEYSPESLKASTINFNELTLAYLSILQEQGARDLANDLNPIKDISCPRDCKNAGLWYGYMKGFEAALNILSGISSTKRGKVD